MVKFGKARPFGATATAHVPNVLVALAQAKQLGYPTRGAALVTDALARADLHVMFS